METTAKSEQRFAAHLRVRRKELAPAALAEALERLEEADEPGPPEMAVDELVEAAA